jgi:hypothetical protein
MGATLVLGTSVERRESSNLSLVTLNWEYRIVAIATDCKSVLIRVRRFESFYSHQIKNNGNIRNTVQELHG